MTPHIEAGLGDYASTVLMPGDPLRAKWIANTFLSDARPVNSIRNCFGYTGTYKGKPVSVQASGMGQASLGIYATELFKFYNVDNIIRVGTCGAFKDNMSLGDLVIALSATTDTGTGSMPQCDSSLLTAISAIGHRGTVCSTDFFYHDSDNWWKILSEQGVLAVDMETYLLYLLAIKYNKHALSVNTVSDNLVTGLHMPTRDREVGLFTMVETVLESL